MKFGPALLIPYLWATRPETRRPIVVGCGIFAAACLASLAIAPGLWNDYVGTFGWEASSQMRAMFVYAIFPDHGGTDFVVRFAIAAVLILIAIRWRLDWLAFVAATATMPIFSLTRMAVLIALWPLCLRGVVDRWRQADTPAQRWLTAPLIHLHMLDPLPDGAPARAGEASGGGRLGPRSTDPPGRVAVTIPDQRPRPNEAHVVAEFRGDDLHAGPGHPERRARHLVACRRQPAFALAFGERSAHHDPIRVERVHPAHARDREGSPRLLHQPRAEGVSSGLALGDVAAGERPGRRAIREERRGHGPG